MILKRQKTKAPKVRPKRPMARVLQSVRQVLKITHVNAGEAIWQWGQPESPTLPSTIELVVWNIWKGSGGEPFLKEYLRIVQGRHLLLLQEVVLTLKALGNFAPKGFAASHGATYRRSDGLRDGVMTVATATPEEGAQRILCETPEPLLKTTKATLVTTYKVNGVDSQLCVVNTHATLIRRPSTAVKEIQRVIECIAGHSGPLIYAGDFNTFSKTYINEVDRAMSSIGLKRVMIEGDPRSVTTALDQIYVRDIEVISAKVDTTFTHSDHFPIIATIRLSVF